MLAPRLEDALHPDFFDRDPLQVARDLLGCSIVRREERDGDLHVVAVTRIVETESYDCPIDPSCYVIERLPGAKPALAGPPGRYYLHRSYDHRLLNVVCKEVGYEAAILVRAVEVLSGETWLRERRFVKRARDLTNGPGKLVTALALNAAFEGQPVNHPLVFFTKERDVPNEDVRITTRIGLSRGADLPWRFVLAGNPWVSKALPSPRDGQAT
ncbi:DNA-3-methyladenine glycosylase [Deinococcus yavapaiensis]|uniref:Putative 3-methyladenine DNA glycosylase n=1 Tax=Deinococcus yavapaiensis KR-236 TaxID=694435 RepID=A0A318SF51_9DEIO|nr:DNA-3-methyladenine glycosylase [Deinococcus yavapaiensis]PYE55332.1 DNA-3-methyladenine glycosylase [Deinococcus yavapaiensis KR-236]